MRSAITSLDARRGDRAAGRGRGIEDRQAADVAGLPCALQREELRVEAGELPHQPILSDSRAPLPGVHARVRLSPCRR